MTWAIDSSPGKGHTSGAPLEQDGAAAHQGMVLPQVVFDRSYEDRCSAQFPASSRCTGVCTVHARTPCRGIPVVHQGMVLPQVVFTLYTLCRKSRCNTVRLRCIVLYVFLRKDVHQVSARMPRHTTATTPRARGWLESFAHCPLPLPLPLQVLRPWQPHGAPHAAGDVPAG